MGPEAALIAGGADLLGGILGNSSAKKAAKTANAFTVNMMQNKHLWEVNDLRQAGLNPILSAGGSPSMGSAAKADVPNSNLGNSVSKGINTGLAVSKNSPEIAVLKSQEALNAGSARKVAAETQGIVYDNVLKSKIAELMGGSLGDAGGLAKVFGGALGGLGIGALGGRLLGGATSAAKGVSKLSKGFGVTPKATGSFVGNSYGGKSGWESVKKSLPSQFKK